MPCLYETSHETGVPECNDAVNVVTNEEPLHLNVTVGFYCSQIAGDLFKNKSLELFDPLRSL